MGSDRYEIATELRHTLRVLRRQAWLIALCVIVAAAVAFAIAASKTSRYSATAQLLIRPDATLVSFPGTPATASDPVRARATALQMVTIPRVAARAYAQVRARDTGVSVSTSSPGDSDIVQVTATDRYADEAAALANAFANQYIAYSAETNAARFTQAAAAIRAAAHAARGSGGRSTNPAHAQDVALLRAQANRLNLLARAQSPDAQLVQQADVPGTRQPDHRVRYLLIGAAVGLLIGLALAFLREHLQGRVAREEEVGELAPGIPVIAYVPAGRGRDGLSALGQGIQSLCISLDAMRPDGEGRSFLVTSATAQDGKSTTALNLALALEERDDSVLLLEADLRRPKLAAVAQVDQRRPGMTKVLSGKATLDEASQRASFEPARNNGGRPYIALRGDLPVVPAGGTSQKPHALITDRNVSAVLASAREQARSVVIDGPPLGAVADMIPFARQVDGVVVVVRLDHTRPRQLRRVVAQLRNAGVEPLGLVVVGADAEDAPY